jgi:Mg/Co/Ni transporter MgtE
VLEALPLDDRRTIWEQVSAEQAGEVFVEVSDAVRESLVEATPREDLIRMHLVDKNSGSSSVVLRGAPDAVMRVCSRFL